MSLLTVVVPCYNEEENVPFFYGELMKNEPFFDEKGIELELLGSLTPEHLEITHKASNGLIFLSNFQFTIPRYS